MVVVCDNVIRRCLSGLGNTVVMVFAAPFGITIRGILMHAGVSRFSACVNSEWLQAVRVVICELRRGFLGSDFYVDCLLGLRGDQTAAAYIFEQCTRATLRQHLFLQDLRDQETLPRVEPFWSEGWDLGIRNYWQYIQPSSASQMGQDGGGVPIARAKRTLTVLRIIRYATGYLDERHGASVLVCIECTHWYDTISVDNATQFAADLGVPVAAFRNPRGGRASMTDCQAALPAINSPLWDAQQVKCAGVTRQAAALNPNAGTNGVTPLPN